MSEAQENKKIVQQWFELITEHKVDDICEMTTSDWLMHGGLPGLSPGPDGVRQLFASFGEIEQTWTIEDIIAEGDKVVVRAINTCTQDSFLGIPAHGRQQTFTATFIHRLVDGKIAETWRNADDLGRVIQLGARIQPGNLGQAL
ncbi:hypothetical protein NIES2111_62180 (plasmid) [Nostoc sp. NIES-2111]|nr:hypothetical protein NIES2111_62180 [Nostoc sp. NIES-2111]